jgi:hypothetical protein
MEKPFEIRNGIALVEIEGDWEEVYWDKYFPVKDDRTKKAPSYVGVKNNIHHWINCPFKVGQIIEGVEKCYWVPTEKCINKEGECHWNPTETCPQPCPHRITGIEVETFVSVQIDERDNAVKTGKPDKHYWKLSCEVKK